MCINTCYPFRVVRSICKWQGLPSTLLSDNARTFESSVKKEWSDTYFLSRSKQNRQTTKCRVIQVSHCKDHNQWLTVIQDAEKFFEENFWDFDFDYQGTTEDSSITQSSQLSSRRLARNSACPPSVFSFTQSRTAATRRANLRKIHLHLEYRRI